MSSAWEEEERHDGELRKALEERDDARDLVRSLVRAVDRPTLVERFRQARRAMEVWGDD